ncbi:MAG: hypothetical protein M3Y56_06675 [Armatimonadota bacterium]|nr:hypothetical protein [Armatimonadota bacterium]
MIVSARTRLIILFLVTSTLLPTAAQADAGTVLMLATALHLLVGNAFNGLFEGLLIAYLFRLTKGRTVRLFIIGNYFSAFAGGWMLSYLWVPVESLFRGEALLFHIPILLGAMWGFSWLLTVILEWPFCYGALQRSERTGSRETLLHPTVLHETSSLGLSDVEGRVRPLTTKDRIMMALKVSLIAQTASYALLTPYFFYASNLSLYHETRLQKDLSFVQQPSAIVYYMNGQDGSIWKIGTDGTGKSRVSTPPHSDEGFLMLKPERPPNHCSLWLIDYDDNSGEGAKPRSEIKLLSHLHGHCAEATEESDYSERVLDFRGDTDHDWNVLTGRYAWGALTITNRGKRAYRLGMETPFFHWTCGFTTILPGDEAVFMAGYSEEDAQVLVLNMKSRRLGVLAVGRSPVVLLPPGAAPSGMRIKLY